jgi:hypothetical protein
LKRETCKHLEKLQNSFESYFCLYGIKVEPWIGNPFLSDINCIENVDLAKMKSLILGQKTYYRWNLTENALENCGVP